MKFVFIVLSVLSVVIAQFPPEGMYITLRNDALINIAQELSLQISDQANAYTSTPDQSGQTSDASYTLSSFVYDINLQEPVISSSGAGEINIQWNMFDFLIQFNYHMCANSWPNPCEDGWIQIYTANDQAAQLQLGATLSFSGPTVAFTTNSVNLVSQQNGIEIFVQCTNTICLIPPDDIANGIASSFQSAFQTAIQNVSNQVAAEYLNTISTTIPLTDVNLDIELAGGFVVNPATNPNLCIFAEGVFSPDGTKQPPFTPNFVPPIAAFNTPANQLDFLFTEFMIQTAIWALNVDGDFNMTIVSADVPASSPVQLKTDNLFFRQAVPSLEHFPNMNITVKTALVNISSVELSAANGASAMNTLWMDFYLVNETADIYGWSLIVDIGASLTLAASMSGSDIQLQVTPGSFKASCQVLKSNIGDVSEHDFNVVLGIALQAIGSTAHTFLIPTPSYFTISNPVITINDGYGDIGCSVAYATNVPVISCSADLSCPVQNTCCQWSGTWGCCTLPTAVCCSTGGCCQQGTQCTDEGCQ